LGFILGISGKIYFPIKTIAAVYKHKKAKKIASSPCRANK